MVIGAFPLSFDVDIEGVGIGSSTVDEMIEGSREVMEGATFNFFVARFSSSSEEAEC